jgi:hypothetical protein
MNDDGVMAKLASTTTTTLDERTSSSCLSVRDACCSLLVACVIKIESKIKYTVK